VLLLTEGQASDHRGAALLLHKLPPGRELIADRGYDSGHFRAALAERGETDPEQDQAWNDDLGHPQHEIEEDPDQPAVPGLA
jgi:transposase